MRVVDVYRGPADWRPPHAALASPPDREHATFWPTREELLPDGRTLRYSARLGYAWPAAETTGPRLHVGCTRTAAGPASVRAVSWEPLPWPRTPARPATAATWTVAIPEGLEPPCYPTLHARLGAYPWRWQGGITWTVEALP